MTRSSIGPLLLTLAACTAPAPSNPGTPPPPFGHVVLVLEENTNYARAVGSGAMPYLDSLAGANGLATAYYADTHPSIGNYFMLTTGRIITNNDGYSGTVTADNVVRHLVAAGKTWKSYAENLPSAGYTGDGPSPYARRHNPFAYLSDVIDDSIQRKRLVPFTQFATDLAGDTLPAYAFVVPNLCHDAHDCALDSADTWLRRQLPPLLQSPTFKQNGLLIITFDEAGSDAARGGGRIAWVAVSARSKPGYRSTMLYQHASTLRLTMEVLGLTAFPGTAATAPAMGEFFN
jgi:phosphatidylinositol-3-phosphatase